MATLSCAMVGPMDGIELLNATRVMTTCRGDGVVLKPDKPVTTVDSCFRYSVIGTLNFFPLTSCIHKQGRFTPILLHLPHLQRHSRVRQGALPL